MTLYQSESLIVVGAGVEMSDSKKISLIKYFLPPYEIFMLIESALSYLA